MKKSLLLFVIIAVLLVTIFFANPSKDTKVKEEKHLCTPESRLADFCIEIYQPVCGWNDPDKIKCITYPCAQTYSNSCFSCMDENVLYYTEGECPKP